VKALLVRLSSIGDVVHTLPALLALTRAGHEAGWIVEPAARPLLEGHPLLSAGTFEAPAARGFALGKARPVLARLRAAAFDGALDFQGLWKSAAWARFSGARRVIGFTRAFRRETASALLVRERVPQPAEARHVIDKNLALLRPLGIEALGLREFPLPDLTAEGLRVGEALRALPRSPLQPGSFVILNPGGGWESKLWPAERFAALARSLAEDGTRTLVTFGPGEDGLADRIVKASGGAAQKGFPTTLREYVELARRARLVVAADTGPLHLACAVGTPVVALFGPTDPERNGPFRAEDRVVRRTPACAPCYRRQCPTHAGVMSTLPVDEVARAVRERLAAALVGKGPTRPGGA
jgi:ADP-heptose:LPS heptosyltransferase